MSCWDITIPASPAMTQCCNVCVSLSPLNPKQGLWRRNCVGYCLLSVTPATLNLFPAKEKILLKPCPWLPLHWRFLFLPASQHGCSVAGLVFIYHSKPISASLRPVLQMLLSVSCLLATNRPLVKGQATNGWQKLLGVHYNCWPAAVTENFNCHRAII